MSDVQLVSGGPAMLQPPNSEQYFADTGVTVPRCAVVCFSSSPDRVKLAKANALATSLGLGLSTLTAAPGAMLWAKFAGILEASEAQWNAVVEGGGALTPGAPYYLSAADAGKITTTAPVGSGDFVVLAGIAVSETSLNITIGTPTSPPGEVIG